MSEHEVTDKAYIILAGVEGEEGVVITRKNKGYDHMKHLGGDDDVWYLVQTNSDHWKDGCTDRCAAATSNMEKIGIKNINRDNLASDVLKQAPNLNEGSIYITTMSASVPGSYYSEPVSSDAPALDIVFTQI